MLRRLGYFRVSIFALSILLLCGQWVLLPQVAAGQTTGDVILHPADLEPFLPKTVFFRGQSAPIQLRNSSGIKFPDGMFFFTTLVDTSGYSTSVKAKYQAYLVTEVPIFIGTQALAPGAYGVGFIADHKFVLMDIGAHDLFTVNDERDDNLKRPTPLQIIAGDHASEYRLYEGREFVTFRRAAK